MLLIHSKLNSFRSHSYLGLYLYRFSVDLTSCLLPFLFLKGHFRVGVGLFTISHSLDLGSDIRRSAPSESNHFPL